MTEKKRPESFGLEPSRLPPELESFINILQTLKPEGSYRSEVEHYWEEACEGPRENRSSFIAHAMFALRERFRDVIDEEEDEDDLLNRLYADDN